MSDPQLDMELKAAAEAMQKLAKASDEVFKHVQALSVNGGSALHQFLSKVTLATKDATRMQQLFQEELQTSLSKLGGDMVKGTGHFTATAKKLRDAFETHYTAMRATNQKFTLDYFESWKRMGVSLKGEAKATYNILKEEAAKSAKDVLSTQRELNAAIQQLAAETDVKTAAKFAKTRATTPAGLQAVVDKVSLEAAVQGLKNSRNELEKYVGASQADQIAKTRATTVAGLQAARERVDGELRLIKQGIAVEANMRQQADLAKIIQAKKTADTLAAIARSQVQGAMLAPSGAFSQISSGKVVMPTQAVTGFTGALAQMRVAMRQTAVDGNDLHSAVRGLASGFNLLWLTWGNTLPLFTGAAISFGVKSVISLGAQVNNTFETIRVLSEESKESVTALNQQMLQLASTGPLGPLAIADAMKILSLAGMSASEVSASIKDVMNFAVAGDVDLKKAADTMTTVATAFSISANAYNYVGDVIAKTAAVSKSSVESIGEAFKTSSVLNKQYGVSLVDVGVGLAALANLGIQGSAAGTALRNMYVDLSGRTRESSAALKKFNIDLRDSRGNMKDLITITSDLNKAVSTMGGKAGKDWLQTVFSERGAKPITELLDLMRTKAKEAGTDVETELERLRTRIEDSAGFAIKAAATMAMSPLNEMKAVTATLQSELIRAFDAVSPAVVKVSQQLRALFTSPEFRQGLENLVVTAGRLAIAITENIGPLTTLLGVFMSFKAGQLVAQVVKAAGASFTQLATAATATSAATSAAGLGLSTLAGGVVKVTSSGLVVWLGRALSLLNPLTGAVMAGVTAWQLWSFFNDKANDSLKNSVTGGNHETYIAYLETETKRIREQTEALRQGISVEDLRQKKEADRLKNATEIGQNEAIFKATQARDKIASQIANFDLNVKSTQGDSLMAVRRQELFKQLSAANATLDKLKADALATRLLVAATERASEAAASRLARQVEKQAAAKETARPLGDLAFEEKQRQAAEYQKKTTALYQVAELREATKHYDNLLSAAKKAADQQSELLESKHRNGLITEGEYQAQLMVAASTTEEKLLGIATDSEKALQAAFLAAREELVKGLKGDDLDKALLTLAGSYSTLMDKIRTDAKATTDTGFIRIVKGSDNAAGAIKKLDKEVDSFLSKNANELLSNTVEVGEALDKYAAAGMEAAAKQAEKYANILDRVNAELVVAQDTLKSLQTFGGSTAQIEAAQAQVNELEAILAKVKNRAGADAATAAQSAINKLRAADFREFTNAIAKAIVDGGDKAGEQLVAVLQEELLRKPLRTVVNATVNQLTQGLGGVIGSALGSSSFGSFFGSASLSSLGSAFGSSFASSALMTLNGGFGVALEGGVAMLGSATGLQSAAAALGQIAGALGPIALAAGGIAYIAEGLSGGKEYTTGVGISGRFGASDTSVVNYQSWKNEGSKLFGFSVGSSSSGTNYSGVEAKYAQSFRTQAETVRNSMTQFAEYLKLDVAAVKSHSEDFKIALTDDVEKNKAAIAGAFSKFADNLADKAIGSSGYSLETFAKEGETSSATLTRLATSLALVNQHLELVNDDLITTANNATYFANKASMLVDAFGGQDAFTSASTAYYNSMYTEQERSAKSLQMLKSEFAKLNLEFPTSIDGYNKLRNSLDLTDTSGREAYVTLTKLGPTYAELAKQQEAAAKAASDAVKAQLEKDLENTKSWVEKWAVLTGARTSRQIQLEKDLAATNDEYTKSLIRSVYAYETLQAAFADAKTKQEEFNSAVASLKSAIDSAKSALSTAQSAMQSVQQEATSAYVSALNSVTSAQEAVVAAQKELAEAQASVAREAANKVIQAQIDIAEAANAAAKEMGELSKTLYDFVNDTRATPAEKFSQLISKALAGDKAAMSELPNAATAAMESAKLTASSAVDFLIAKQGILNQVSAVAAQAAIAAAATVTVPTLIPEPTVDPVAAATEKLATAQTALAASQQTLASALQVANTIGAPLANAAENLVLKFNEAAEQAAIARADWAKLQATFDAISSYTSKSATVDEAALLKLQELKASQADLIASVATQLTSGFDKLDVNTNGLLSASEFVAGLKGIATDAELLKLYSLIDSNGDLQLTKLEAVNATFSAQFSKLDTSVNGLLDFDEFKLGLAGTASDTTLWALFNKLDTDGNQQLSALEVIGANTLLTASNVATYATGANQTVAFAVNDPIHSVFNNISRTNELLIDSQQLMLHQLLGVAINEDLTAAGAFNSAFQGTYSIQADSLQVLHGIAYHTQQTVSLLGSVSAYASQIKDLQNATVSTLIAQYNHHQYISAAGQYIRFARGGPGENVYATGGVFTNSIVRRPTFFNESLMGEKGPEAIMPLTNVGGSLGVSTANLIDYNAIAEAAQIRAMNVGSTNEGAMLAELAAIRQELYNVRAETKATAVSNAKIAKDIREFRDNGLQVKTASDEPLKTEPVV